MQDRGKTVQQILDFFPAPSSLFHTESRIHVKKNLWESKLVQPENEKEKGNIVLVRCEAQAYLTLIANNRERFCREQ